MSLSHIEHLHRRLTDSNVPEQLHDGLAHYVSARRPVGQFLTAVLSNDLKDAVSRADDVCRVHLHSIVFFLYNYAPGHCWGSREHVEAWLSDPQPAPEVFE